MFKFLLKNGSTKFNEISSIDRAPKIENHKEFLKNINNLYNNLISNEDFKNDIDYINNSNEIYDSIGTENFIKNNNNNKNNDNSNNFFDSEISSISNISNNNNVNNNNLNNNNNDIFVLNEEVNKFGNRIKKDNELLDKNKDNNNEDLLLSVLEE